MRRGLNTRVKAGCRILDQLNLVTLEAFPTSMDGRDNGTEEEFRGRLGEKGTDFGLQEVAD